MDLLDSDCDTTEGDEVLVPSSQVQDTPRPRKRRRLDPKKSTREDEYDLPSNDYHADEDGAHEYPEYQSKYEARTHYPEFEGPQKDTFVTQLTQPWSSPTRIRPPRWKKQTAPFSPGRVSPKDDVVHVQQAPPPPKPTIQHSAVGPTNHPEPTMGNDNEFDDDDPDLLEALMSSQGVSVQHNDNQAQANPPSITTLPAPAQNYRQTTLFGDKVTTPLTSTQRARTHNWPLANKNEPPTHHSLDVEALKTWIYPTNLGRIRDYQYNIVYKALFKNLLVALPTGLGKTFIAATVMLNWYRWTKVAQIVFVAPTKPLVAQQIEACLKIAGIPRSDSTMLTGEVDSSVRAEDWQEKRVFFMTPQTLVNDLKSGIADPKRIVLLVVDEAHKATGNYAYVEAVRFMRRFNESFRVMGLTATPGGNVEAVQKVIDGLDIARTEIRTEDSIDIRQFVHPRDVEVQTFQYSDEINEILDLFRKALQPTQNELCKQNVYWMKDPACNTQYGLMKARDSWRSSEVFRKMPQGLKGKVYRLFALLMSLAHSVQLLKFHGVGPFLHKMKTWEEEAYVKGGMAQQIVDAQPFREMMSLLKRWINNPEFVGHPKLAYLKDAVLNHFMDASEGRGAAGGRPPSDTRIMVFAHYRDSAEEIVRVLNKYSPMVRSHVFVGQSGTKSSAGMNQEAQNKMIEQFKAGTFNTLIATSIGEEGLDIGEVDLIICYDSSKSPVRMLQRMGRTGRKRAGKIIVTLMEDKEKRDWEEAQDGYAKMQEKIEHGTEFTYHEDRSRRLVPKDIEPVVDKRVVEIPYENTQDVNIDPRKRKPKNPKTKRPAKKFHMPDGVETGFTFLGAGTRGRPKTTGKAPVMDLVEAACPPLGDVLLTQDEQVQLAQCYREIAGTEPQYIQQVRVDAYPATQRRLGRTRLVKHSCTTKALIGAYKSMRWSDRDWTRPTGDEEEWMSGPARLNKPGATSQAPKKTRPQKRQRVSLSEDRETPSSDAFGDTNSFIDDATPKSAPQSSSTPASSPPLEPGTSKALPAREEQPFWLSQGSQRLDHVSQDSELPELDDLVAAAGKTSRRRPREHETVRADSPRAAKTGRGGRCVVDGDDE